MGLSNDSHVTAYGYRADKKYVQEVGLRKCFLTGGNSTLRQHCRKHYEIYKQRCEESNIPLNDRAIPPQILKKKDKGKLTKQMTIDNMLDKGVARRQEFSKEAILRAASQFVACDDQALSVAGSVYFRNCLVAMRPGTTCSELATAHEVHVHIHNACVEWLTQLKNDISVRSAYRIALNTH